MMIFGVIAVAAGTQLRMSDLTAPTPAFEAWLIAGGALLFLLGSAGFRLAMRFGALRPRVLGALLCVATVPMSQRVSAAAGLGTIAVVIAAMLVVEHAYETGGWSAARALHHPHVEVSR